MLRFAQLQSLAIFVFAKLGGEHPLFKYITLTGPGV
jgi:hypothetical protein